ncbi:hypothetical protein H2201_002344 [Coniosporium apollinis]|uniref:Carrier domain-containing protein n=1 Tax=Coniosporium apollinis TaxID=61459 RepID=A0ABQ9NYN4_9PEZI|nr:hypothetical protein H2201_002344 [Coniosporium apollinis]
MTSQPWLLVFGPQTTWPTTSQLSSLREVLLTDSRLHPLLDAVRNLTDSWKDLLAFRADLDAVEGFKVSEAFQNWAKGEDLSWASERPPNALITPLTVLIHILQYFQYLARSDVTHAEVLERTRVCGIQGFCTGFLSALATSAAKTEADIGVLSAVAFRLALCIGAFVDREGVKNPAGTGSCLAVRHKSEESRGKLKNILQQFPDAYVSVVTDSSGVTVTTNTSQRDEIYRALEEERLSVKPVEVNGRFHSPIHTETVQDLKRYCALHHELQLPAVDSLATPLRSNIDSELVSGGPLHEIALDLMLLRQSNWYPAFLSALDQNEVSESPTVVVAGLVDPVPSSVLRDRRLKVSKLINLEADSGPAGRKRKFPDHAVAIVGMSCKFPGADSVEEYWRLLNDGLTVVDQVPEPRFATSSLRRTADGKTPFWGSFVRDADAFDHEFFKKSPREAASMDPKQRMLLEAAYQAMESSGQWALGDAYGEHVGCFVGVATDDYYDNVNSHAPNAFSATGTLRAFLSGKISHFFGWTGPSITYDTACSSSMVAIHAACKAIQLGECSRAIAGGVNSISSPNMYQNLAAATFLSKTGICKPFDAKADGYCRGEGVGLVVLKKLSAALEDGDNVLGVITGTATNQNSNETAITVPHSGSQMELYEQVLADSGVQPDEVSYVEAHGTGTPVGDPRETLSIRQLFGGPNRPDVLHLGSAKGNIGHLEAASGVASLIKTLLMIQHQTIPKSASFTVMNPNIPPLEPDSMAISTTSKPWTPVSDCRIACINNYGASGNNAAMILCQKPSNPKATTHQALSKYPIFVSAKAEESLNNYCNLLRKEFQSSNVTLPDLAYHLQRTQNRSLQYALSTTATDLDDLYSKLSNPDLFRLPSKAKPVVLAFGGQSTDRVGLDEGIYGSSTLFRRHIDNCDTALRNSGLEGVLPTIFSQNPVEDVSVLHACLFTIQYATAMTWIDAGLPVDALIGHSFGQLTALCVSGSLSLEDGLRLVTGRAALMKELWGPVRGSMISVEASSETAEHLVSMVMQSAPGRQLEIACYNGPTSHTLVGNPTGVDAVAEMIAAQPNLFASVKTRKLNTTHGFHSVFTEPLLPEITALAKTLKFAEKPKIHLETCSRGGTWTDIKPEMLAEHTRTPVYFGEAVDRLADRFGPCTWIEAGTGSSITGMVRRALGAPQSSLHSFETVQLNKSDAVSSLADVVTSLWKNGYNLRFWPFHRVQSEQYSHINLPPYQFKKSRHWIPYQDASNAPVPKPIEGTESRNLKEAPLIEFTKFLDDKQEVAKFSVNKHNEQFQLCVKGHAVLDQPLCPAGEYLELAVRAANMLQPDSDHSTYLWSVEKLSIMAPLGLDTQTPLNLQLSQVKGTKSTFEFQLMSEPPSGGSGKPTLQSTGRVSLHSTDNDATTKEFARTERLVNSGRYDALVRDDDAELLQGAMIYKVFSKVVSYSDFYKGIKKISARDSEIAAHVSMPLHSLPALNGTLCNTLAIDNFLQVAGVHVNCLKDCADGEVYVATQVERIQVRAGFNDGSPSSWLVYSNFLRTSERDVINDVYVFDERTNNLVMLIHGVCFTKVLISALARTLNRANTAKEVSGQASKSGASTPKTTSRTSTPKTKSRASMTPSEKSAESKARSAQSVSGTPLALKKLINQVADIPVDSMGDQSTLEDVGIDSLMVHEVQSEIKSEFSIELPSTEIGTMSISSLAKYIDGKNGMGDIESAFGVQIEQGFLTSESTFGQLTDKVFPPQASTPARVKATSKPEKPPRKGKIDMETVLWKECGPVKLYADIYLPNSVQSPRGDWPVALMIHGGGHTMLSRKDVRPPQTQYLLDNGFLPISVDYRLSPEINIRDGAMNDVCDALDWIRTGLPKLHLKLPGLKVNGEKIVAVGWSTGGTLSMTLPFTSLKRGIKPPAAILAFYCPTDYEADFWKQPNYPEDSRSASSKAYDLLEGVGSQPITAYNIPTGKSNVGGWMNLEDPRSRIVLHMNWKGQALPVLLNGLPSKAQLQSPSKESTYYSLPIPSKEDIVSISPASQIRMGNYHVPTFLIHGTKDDLIPWQQTQQTYENLSARGVPAGVRILEDKVHLYDLYRDPTNDGWRAARDGYDFLFSFVE